MCHLRAVVGGWSLKKGYAIEYVQIYGMFMKTQCKSFWFIGSVKGLCGPVFKGFAFCVLSVMFMAQL